MEGIKALRYKIALAVLFLFVLGYVLFFKPNPIVRFNVNKLQAHNGESSALTIEAPSEVEGVGKRFTVQVKLDTKGYAVNAVQSYLQFDSRVIEVVKTDTSQSFCKFYPENNFSNDKGLIKLACGAPYPGFSGQNTLISVEFLSKAIKSTPLTLTKDSMVLANDGKGTNLLKDFDSKEIQIKAGL